MRRASLLARLRVWLEMGRWDKRSLHWLAALPSAILGSPHTDFSPAGMDAHLREAAAQDAAEARLRTSQPGADPQPLSQSEADAVEFAQARKRTVRDPNEPFAKLWKW